MCWCGAGFCGETEEEHLDTLDLIRKTQYDQAFMFAYSEREKTHAARHLDDNVPAEVKSRRLQEIIAAFREGQLKQFQAEVGRTHLVSCSHLSCHPVFLNHTHLVILLIPIPHHSINLTLEFVAGAVTNSRVCDAYIKTHRAFLRQHAQGQYTSGYRTAQGFLTAACAGAVHIGLTCSRTFRISITAETLLEGLGVSLWP